MIHYFLAMLIPIGSVAIGFLPALIIVWWWRKKQSENRRYSPLGKDMLRPPGHSLRMAIEEVDETIQFWIIALTMTPLFLTLNCVCMIFIGNTAPITGIGSSLFIAIVAYVVFARLCWNSISKRQDLVLGYEGELATAQALNQLMFDGYRVFHDIPCDCGNIDHVVVGQNGVFSVNSKGYSKPQKKNNIATVDYAKSKIKLTSREVDLPRKQVNTERIG